MENSFYTEGSNVKEDNMVVPPMGKAMPLPDDNQMIVNEVRNGDDSGYHMYDGGRTIKMNDFKDNTAYNMPICRPSQMIEERLKAKENAIKKELEQSIKERKRAQLNEEQQFITNLKLTNNFEFGMIVDLSYILSGDYKKAIYNIISSSCYDIKTNKLSAMFINFHLYCRDTKNRDIIESRLSPFLPPMKLIEEPLEERNYELGTNPQLILDRDEEFNINSVLYVKMYKDVNGEFRVDESYSGSTFTDSLLNKLDKMKEFKDLNSSLESDVATGLEISLGLLPLPTVNVLNILIPIDGFFPVFKLDDFIAQDAFIYEFADAELRQFDGKLTLDCDMLFYTTSKEEKEKIFHESLHKLYSTQTNKFVIVDNQEGSPFLTAQLALSDSQGLSSIEKDVLSINSNVLYNISNYKVNKLYKVMTKSTLTLFK